MHDDEFREEQKREMVKLLCWMTTMLIGLAISVLAYVGFVCMTQHWAELN